MEISTSRTVWKSPSVPEFLELSGTEAVIEKIHATKNPSFNAI